MIFRTSVQFNFEISESEVILKMKNIKFHPKPTFEQVAARIARDKVIEHIKENEHFTHRGIEPEAVEIKVQLIEEKFKEVPF
jgi:hypothetical protein